MANTALDRVWYDTLVDDDGSGLTGTVIDKADMDAILDVCEYPYSNASGVGFGGPIRERNRTLAMGEWANVSFVNTNFTAVGSMLWDVASGDVNMYRYKYLANTMTLAFKVSTTTVAGTPNTTLRIAIPDGKVVATGSTWSVPIAYYQGTWIQGWAEAASGEAYVRLFTTGFGSGNWAASSNGTYLQGYIDFQFM